LALSLTVAVIADSMGDAGSGDGQVAAFRSWLVLKHCQVVLNPFAEIVVDFRVENNSARAMILKRWNVNFIILAANIDMILVGGRTACSNHRHQLISRCKFRNRIKIRICNFQC
jgi:hypothetical protein